MPKLSPDKQAARNKKFSETIKRKKLALVQNSVQSFPLDAIPERAQRSTRVVTNSSETKVRLLLALEVTKLLRQIL